MRGKATKERCRADPASLLLRALICFVSSLLVPTAVAAQEGNDSSPAGTFSKAPAPAWTKRYEVDLREAPESDKVGSTAYVLVERQQDQATETAYYRFALRFLNQKGVQESSQLTVDYDPSYQRIRFHTLILHRGGKTIDRLPDQDFRILKRETDHERQIYDGNLSALAVVEDVRVGDTLEYAYSVEGANPVFEGQFFARFGTSWSVAVAHLRLRLLWQGPRELRMQNFNTTLTPKRRNHFDLGEYEWTDDGVPAILLDDGVPSFHDPYGSIELSDYASWSEVARWATRQYPVEADLPREAERKVREIAALPTKEQRVLAALGYVQDEIRYVGVVEGMHSHRPHPLETVLRRRFGDCKDKSLLLTSLLRRIGLEARPALVHTRRRHKVEENLPSPFAFNHVVVRVVTGGQEHWLDATSSYQRGPLDEIHFPDYGRALVLDPRSSGLTVVEGNGFGACRRHIVESFHLDDYRGGATLAVTSRYHGCEADRMRSYFASRSRAEIEKSYRDFYSVDYGNLEIFLPIEVEDDEKDNTLTVTELYRIHDIWKPQERESDEDDERFVARFRARTLDGQIPEPSSRIRTMPFEIPHPKSIRQTIGIHFPTVLTFERESTRIENPVFTFSFDATPVDNSLQLAYEYTTHADHVAADATQQYVDDAERASGETIYSVWIPKSYREELPPDEVAEPDAVADTGDGREPPSKDENTRPEAEDVLVAEGGAEGGVEIPNTGEDASSGGERIAGEGRERWLPNLPVIAVAGLALLFFGLGFGLLGRWRPPFDTRRREGPRPRGIAVWLLLASLWIVVAFVFDAGSLVLRVVETAGIGEWIGRVDPGGASYHPVWQVTVLCDIILRSALLSFDTLLIVLLLKKRYTLPTLFIANLALRFMASLGLLAAYEGIPGIDPDTVLAFKLEVAGVGASCLVWVPYLRMSRRVQAAFVRGPGTDTEKSVDTKGSVPPPLPSTGGL